MEKIFTDELTVNPIKALDLINRLIKQTKANFSELSEVISSIANHFKQLKDIILFKTLKSPVYYFLLDNIMLNLLGLGELKIVKILLQEPNDFSGWIERKEIYLFQSLNKGYLLGFVGLLNFLKHHNYTICYTSITRQLIRLLLTKKMEIELLIVLRLVKKSLIDQYNDEIAREIQKWKRSTNLKKVRNRIKRLQITIKEYYE